MDEIAKNLLFKIADLHEIPSGAFSFRENGKSVVINSTANIEIVKKQDKSGIDIFIKPNTKNQSLHIPVVITQGGVNDLVYNDFHIAENCDVLIVAGCGIHNADKTSSQHDGIHSFVIGKNSKVKYVERHLGIGSFEKILNPTTMVEMSENAVFEMETTQIGGVSFASRKTTAKLGKNAKLLIKEKILTTENQTAKTAFDVELLGENSVVEVVSRVVAKDSSYQEFSSNILGKNACFGRVECDGIILGGAKIKSNPSVFAENVNASLTHEAQIGKIAGEQLIKLMSLGLSKTEAENTIIEGFLEN